MHNKQNFWLIFHFFLAFGERITLFAGTLSTTIAPAPIFALSPIVISPIIIAPVPIKTLLPIVGYPPLPSSPIVVFWCIVRLSPIR